MQNIKESWQKMSEKTRRLVVGIVAGTVGIALIAILVLTFGQNNDYSVLFSGLSQQKGES